MQEAQNQGTRTIWDNSFDILLIEDEDPHAELIQRAFEDRGGYVHVYRVNSLSEARSYLATHTPTLIIADWRLPDGESLSLLPDRSDPLATPVILMTSYGNERIAVEALKSGALDYVVKSPESMMDMPHLAERAIEQWNVRAEHIRMQQALRASHDRILLVFDSVPADIYVDDIKTYEVLFVNQHMRNSFGDKLVGQVCWQVFRCASGPCAHCTNDQLVDSQGNPTRSVTWEGQNPISRRWYINHDRAIQWVDGKLACVQISVDITERRQIEESLRESEEKMRSIFRAAPTGIGVVNNRILLEVNPRICEMTGYSKEELVGQSARILYPTQEDYEFVGSEKYKQIAQKGSGAVETRWQKKDGSIIDIILASTPIDLADLSKGVTFTALDITERKEAE
jgi:PAS domain S-box-containing protein